MSAQIDIDHEVLDLLKRHAEPFTDTPNSVLRRLLGLTEAVSGTDSVLATSSATEPMQQSGRRRKSRRGVARKPRAPRGTLLPETEYEMPILEALGSQPKGRAPAREVLELIAPALSGRLTDFDLQAINSGEIRWHNRAHFARLHLVRLGQIAADSPRGIWEITQVGRERINAERKR